MNPREFLSVRFLCLTLDCKKIISELNYSVNGFNIHLTSYVRSIWTQQLSLTFCSNDGVSTLQCVDLQPSNRGTYSCEALSRMGSIVATPNTFLTVIDKPSICFPPHFNDGATDQEECIPCFCFGTTNNCKSSNRRRAWVSYLPWVTLMWLLHILKIEKGHAGSAACSLD